MALRGSGGRGRSARNFLTVRLQYAELLERPARLLSCRIFLLSMFAKNEKSDMSQAEKNELKKILKVLPQNYRRARK